MKIGEVNALFALGQVVSYEYDEEGRIITNRLRVVCEYYKSMVDMSLENPYEKIPMAIPMSGYAVEGGDFFQITALPKIGETIVLAFVDNSLAKPLYLPFNFIINTILDPGYMVKEILEDQSIIDGITTITALDLEGDTSSDKIAALKSNFINNKLYDTQTIVERKHNDMAIYPPKPDPEAQPPILDSKINVIQMFKDLYDAGANFAMKLRSNYYTYKFNKEKLIQYIDGTQHILFKTGGTYVLGVEDEDTTFGDRIVLTLFEKSKPLAAGNAVIRITKGGDSKPVIHIEAIDGKIIIESGDIELTGLAKYNGVEIATKDDLP